ncbi:MAG: hypothetical protein U7126_23970 [Microcoleus sp.]
MGIFKVSPKEEGRRKKEEERRKKAKVRSRDRDLYLLVLLPVSRDLGFAH